MVKSMAQIQQKSSGVMGGIVAAGLLLGSIIIVPSEFARRNADEQKDRAMP